MGRTLKKRGNGEGTIYYSEATKKWVGQVTLGRDGNGKQVRKSLYGNTRKEVKEKMDVLLREMERGKDVGNVLSVVDIAEEIRELKYNTNSIKRASYVRIGETIDIMRKILPFANIPIQNVTRSIINIQSQLLTEYSQSVITKVWQQLQGAFNEARIRDIVDKNPFELKGYLMKPKSSKPTKKIDALTIDEEERFIKELDKNITINNKDLRLWYESPAEDSYNGWEKWSLPLGNGYMGASVFGGVEYERIQLTEKTFWSGGPSPSRPNYNGGNIVTNAKVKVNGCSYNESNSRCIC